jgi:hypothetical protein
MLVSQELKKILDYYSPKGREKQYFERCKTRYDKLNQKSALEIDFLLIKVRSKIERKKITVPVFCAIIIVFMITAIGVMIPRLFSLKQGYEQISKIISDISFNDYLKTTLYVLGLFAFGNVACDYKSIWSIGNNR